MASGIGRGAGISASSAADRYSARSWTTAAALDANDYFTFTLDAIPGYEIDFASFVYTGTRSASGPSVFAFRSSLDGFASDIGTPTATGATIDLTASQFQHLTNPIEFRLYGYSAGATTGTYSVNDYTFNGTVVPEPNTLALVGVGSLLMLGNLRRTRKPLETVE
ncbi:MAG: PEP-CTERM sorting domain-containing protein [Chlorobaculum sp.]|nr:PEP-CTERM sorting domain-containing protein [Chlorobaculum sp.]